MTQARICRRWVQREDDLLRSSIPGVPALVLATMLDRSKKAILDRARSIGLSYLAHPARFWAQVERGSGCWPWKGCRQSSGYGCYHLDGRQQQAHRVSYEMAHGPIPTGHHLHHRCQNPLCVNPDHLTPLLPGEHIMIGNAPSARHARQTHCFRGHLFDAANTMVWRNRRKCRACDRARQVRSRNRKRGVEGVTEAQAG